MVSGVRGQKRGRMLTDILPGNGKVRRRGCPTQRTTYILHLSPSLQGANGQMINMTAGGMMGGQFVTGGMMGSGGMMNGQWGPGMTRAGWQASNGTFGMFFTFTTA